MWLDYAFNKGKVDHMFGGALDLDEVELERFGFNSTTSVSFTFVIKGLPEKYPEKWKNKGYNAMSISLEFCEIESLKVDVSGLGFQCSPKIDASSEKAVILIRGDKFSIVCESAFINIEGFTPYIDLRWGSGLA
ncbi:Imm50 family immunity protein [Pseudomonas sp. NPDC089401]|uniref:Imm50 family immunity protein n=1 Tax=Pseudomonas sp. NPDC089401 TaxID=3364462 RepID=UPI00382ED247